MAEKSDVTISEVSRHHEMRNKTQLIANNIPWLQLNFCINKLKCQLYDALTTRKRSDKDFFLALYHKVRRDIISRYNNHPTKQRVNFCE